MSARAHKKFVCEQHSEIYLLTLKEQDKTEMELPLDMVSVSDSIFWALSGAANLMMTWLYLLDCHRTLNIQIGGISRTMDFGLDNPMRDFLHYIDETMITIQPVLYNVSTAHVTSP